MQPPMQPLSPSNETPVRFKTISRLDPEFVTYLDGSFSADLRAIPMRSLNVDSLSEEVTFEIKSFEDIARPSSWRVAWHATRPASLVLSIGPMLATLFYSMAHGHSLAWPVAFSSFLGVLLLHIALNLFNDYSDHMKGQDRLRPKGGSRVIQKGWARAMSVKRAAWTLMGLAVLLGLPAVVLHFAPFLIVGILALLFALEFAFQKLRLKYRGWAEIVGFALTGPLLTTGFAWSITGSFSFSEVVLGCIFGSISLMYFHSANFENIMSDSQAGARTWATRAGFDASKNFFYFTAGLTLFSTFLYVGFIEREPRLYPVFFSQVLFLFPVSLRVKNLASPLSSNLAGLRSEPLKLDWITVIALLGGFLWALAESSRV